MTDNEVRGSAPVYSAKDILQSLDIKMDRVVSQVDILVSQDLGTRVTSLERFRERVMGMSSVGAILGVIGTALGIIAIVMPRGEL